MAWVMDPGYDLVFLSWFHLVPLEGLANSTVHMFNSKTCKYIKKDEINGSIVELQRCFYLWGPKANPAQLDSTPAPAEPTQTRKLKK